MGLIDFDEIERFLAEHPDWLFEDSAIQRTFEFADFAEALAFVNRVGEAAEAMDHHPDIDIRWNKVKLRLSTHSEGGITAKDTALAAEIDGLL
ncbi:MAG TPA: 4a-hydroxytetrahydrobiopterin dehydratase [Acidimicrobiia bacterium]|jgi:4a-hydroxytetrahydrobiopterin dehydratase